MEKLIIIFLLVLFTSSYTHSQSKSEYEKMVTYSIAGDATMFVFPIDVNDITKLKSVFQKF